MIDTTVPSVSILSLKNQTYYTTNVTLAFAVNEPTSWIGYSLDGQDNVTITGNTTLSGLPNGNHNVTVYTTDKAGNVASETISFSVEVPFPTTLVIVPIASVVVVGVGLLIYFKKRQSSKSRASAF